VDNLAVLQALRGEHIWSDDVVEERFHRWRDHSVYAMIVRVFQLAAPASLEVREEYTGCKSWVHLDEEVSVENWRPVIGDDEYSRRVQEAVQGVRMHR